MTAIRINLLPWRMQARLAEKRKFFWQLGSVILVTIVLLGIIFSVLLHHTLQQEQQNNLLQQQVDSYAQPLKKIKQLKTNQQQLQQTLTKITSLQDRQQKIANLFLAMPALLPAQVKLSNLEVQGNKVLLTGEATENSQITALMRNLSAAAWLSSPELTEIKNVAKADSVSEQFEVKFKITPLPDLPPQGGKGPLN